MMRRFVTLDGDVIAEEEYHVKPIDRCFYCNIPLTLINGYAQQCSSQDGNHDFITLVYPDIHRR